MGLFGNKTNNDQTTNDNICPICNKEITLSNMRTKVHLSDAVICNMCMKKADFGFQSFANSKKYSLQSVMNAIAEKEQNKIEKAEQNETFASSRNIAGLIDIDETNKTFRVKNGMFSMPNQVYKLSSILGFDIVEDGITVTSGGLGRGIAGGIIFGPFGGIIGAITGKRKNKGVVDKMSIKLNLNDKSMPVIYIDLIKSKTKKSSSAYKSAASKADEILSSLDGIMKSLEIEAKQQTSTTESSQSSADELRKFKDLLDEGIITQEEFDAKKKELLNL